MFFFSDVSGTTISRYWSTRPTHGSDHYFHTYRPSKIKIFSNSRKITQFSREIVIATGGTVGIGLAEWIIDDNTCLVLYILMDHCQSYHLELKVYLLTKYVCYLHIFGCRDNSWLAFIRLLLILLFSIYHILSSFLFVPFYRKNQKMWWAELWPFPENVDQLLTMFKTKSWRRETSFISWFSRKV